MTPINVGATRAATTARTMGKGNAAIKGQMVVENLLTGETMRVPLGAPRARQWGTPDAATQYLRSLVGADHAELLQDIRVNDVPIDECQNLASMRPVSYTHLTLPTTEYV